MKIKKVFYLSLIIFLLSFFFVPAAMAADFRLGDKSGSISIDKDTKNLYSAGNMISINADIEKSLHAAGNVITIVGDIGNNIYAVGNTVAIKGNVGGTVHMAAANVSIEGEIEDDLFLAGGNIVLTKLTSVGGDLYVAGGTVVVDGSVAGDIHIAGGDITINGKVGGEVNVKADSSLTLGSEAEIGKDLNYKGPKELEVKEGAKISGEINFTKIEVKKAGVFKKSKAIKGLLTLAFLIKLLGAIAAGLVFVYLLRKFTEPAVKESLSRFWPSLGLGFAALILIPVLFVILMITVVGIWLGVLTIATYILSILLSLVLSSIVLGVWLIKIIGRKKDYLVDWKAVVVGVIVMDIIALIPVLGWIVKFVLMLMALGGIYRLAHQKIVLKKS